jgi:nucleoside-diphosphate-sugar epimerase
MSNFRFAEFAANPRLWRLIPLLMNAYHPSRLALTGGTGALGLAFLRAQFRRDPALQATLLVRRGSASFQSDDFQGWLRENESRVTLVDGDLRHLPSGELRSLVEADGGLWHFAALTSLDAACEETAREIHEVNVVGTERLLEIVRKIASPRPFYHVSTAYIVGTRRGVAQETEAAMGQAHRNPYEASKLAAELAVQRAFAAGLPGAIFRPSVVVDDSSGTGGFKMVDACAYTVALAVKRGEPFVFRLHDTASINMVHSDWVIAAMGDLARLASGSGLTYHLTAPKPTYFRDIVAILKSHVPALKIGFEPDVTRADLPPASKLFDKAIAELRPYLEAGIDFDRTNTVRDLSSAVNQEPPLDLAPFVEQRLGSELEKIAHRRGAAAV